MWQVVFTKKEAMFNIYLELFQDCNHLKQKKMKNLGIILIVIGIVMMVVTGFNYVAKKEIVDVGRIEISKEESHPVRWSPIIGGVLLVGGFVMFLADKKKAL